MKPFSFKEALDWARKQKVVLPVEYYGLLFGRARAAAFSVAGISALDQLQAIHDSLLDVMETGGTFAQWRKDALDGKIPLGFPDYRKETIFRTNIQGWYAAGRCRSDQANKASRPYLMYSSINDSSTRPTHAAMDGTILPVDHPWWDDHRPPNGFNCRCSSISLSEEEAKGFGGVTVIAPDAGPDKGWDYSPCKDGPEEGIRRATESRTGRCGQQYEAGIPVELALREPWWCGHPALREQMNRLLDEMGDWQDTEKLARLALGEKAWAKHVEAARVSALEMGLELPEAVVARAYTDFTLDAWPLMNRLARELPHYDALPPMTTDEIARAGLLIHLMDAAIRKLPTMDGVYYRGVKINGLAGRKDAFVKAHTKTKRVVQWNGYSSVMANEHDAYSGRAIFEIFSDHVHDLRSFSVSGEQELIIARGAKFEISDWIIEDGVYYIVLMEADMNKAVRRDYQFVEHSPAEQMVKRHKEWKKRGGNVSAPAKHHAERCAVELGGQIPARFRHLQHLNEDE
jgi:SPP1 gp7 family putative phage head morphogenesis protein